MRSVLNERRQQSEAGLRDVREGLAPKADRFAEERVTLYITGSFGRLEARYRPGLGKGGNSDLDVFFMYVPENGEPTEELSRLAWFELIAAVIDVADSLDFAPFSRDGLFLKPHNVFEVGSELGSRNEDADNGFTARLLLLLEGRPLANDALFEEVLLETVKFYYRDYADKRETFRPYALVNDILRYWRTLCLNYENARESKRARANSDRADIEAVPGVDAQTKQDRIEQRLVDFSAESALDNLKLRYSRLALCFSMISLLVSEPDGIPPERVVELCRIAPADRWGLAAERDPSGHAATLVPQILSAYEGFLGRVADEKRVLRDLRSRKDRQALRRNAGRFGDLVFDLIRHVATDEQFRRLVV